jgi:hypothetical protein
LQDKNFFFFYIEIVAKKENRVPKTEIETIDSPFVSHASFICFSKKKHGLKRKEERMSSLLHKRASPESELMATTSKRAKLVAKQLAALRPRVSGGAGLDTISINPSTFSLPSSSLLALIPSELLRVELIEKYLLRDLRAVVALMGTCRSLRRLCEPMVDAPNRRCWFDRAQCSLFCMRAMEELEEEEQEQQQEPPFLHSSASVVAWARSPQRAVPLSSYSFLHNNDEDAKKKKAKTAVQRCVDGLLFWSCWQFSTFHPSATLSECRHLCAPCKNNPSRQTLYLQNAASLARYCVRMGVQLVPSLQRLSTFHRNAALRDMLSSTMQGLPILCFRDLWQQWKYWFAACEPCYDYSSGSPSNPRARFGWLSELCNLCYNSSQIGSRNDRYENEGGVRRYQCGECTYSNDVGMYILSSSSSSTTRSTILCPCCKRRYLDDLQLPEERQSDFFMCSLCCHFFHPDYLGWRYKKAGCKEQPKCYLCAH